MLIGFDYLKNTRHLTEDTIRLFHLGYCDDHGMIYADCDFPDVTLDSRFYKSALFPIFSLYNDLVAVSARTLVENYTGPKYINSVYPKTSHLYGLSQTWKYCLSEKKAYVVEGNVDTIMMYQNDIKNVVGMLGSNLVSKQLCLLARFVEEIVLVPDGDDAGAKFLNKMKEAIVKKHKQFNVQFKVVRLPQKYDPDKFLLEKGKTALLQLEEPLFQTFDNKLREFHD